MGHHLKPEEPLHETVAVLSYQVGRLLEMAMYLYWQRQYYPEEDQRARIGQFKSDLMDVAAQVSLTCEAVEVPLHDMVAFGLEKAEERFSKMERKVL